MTDRPNVVLIVLDTVRRDRVSAYGYDRETTPAFDEFADGATRYEDAVAQSSWSIPSHASMLTGTYPSEHGATTVRPVLQAENTLPARLRRAGYGTYAVSPNVYVRPATGFARGFEEFHTGSRLGIGERWIAPLTPRLNWVTATPRVRRPLERAFNWWWNQGHETGTVTPPSFGVTERVESILGRVTEPFFLFVNLPHAHLPRSPAPEHRERFVDEEHPVESVPANERTHNFGEYTMDTAAMRAMSDLYDADLRTLDDRFRAVLGALSDADLLEDSLVIVTADHGEHLGESGLVGHQHSLLDPVVSVPLVVDFPDTGPETVESQVETRRVYHTILDGAGVERYPDRTLASGEADETARGSFHSPMLDMVSLLKDGRVEYDRRLLGEPFEFQRGQGRKRLSFDGEQWTETIGSEVDDRFETRDRTAGEGSQYRSRSQEE